MDPLARWREWRTWLSVQNSGSSATVRAYSTAVLRFLAETGCKPLAEYTENDCARFLAEFAPRGKAKHDYAKALRSIFGWAEKRAIILVNPMDGIRLKKPRRVPPIVLTQEELTRLLVAAVFELGERVAWAILLVYSLGIRRMEAAGLRWSHIRTGDTGPVIEIRTTKGADQRDPLPLSPLALECLARLRELPPAQQTLLDDDYILRVRAATLSKWVHQAGTAAGLPPQKIGSHRLRASLATDLLKSGVDVTVVQRVLGHLRLESTHWYLARAEEGEMRSALAMIGYGKAGAA